MIPPETEQTLAPHPPPVCPRVLLIEDDRKIAGDLADELIARGFSIRLEATGPDGLARAREDSFDVLVVDRVLPGLDRLSVIKQPAAGFRRWC